MRSTKAAPRDPPGAGDVMGAGFHSGSRTIQDRFDTRALADRIDGLLVGDTIDDNDRAFIEARDMFFLATADAEGRPTCSYKGGDPGFVRVIDPHTLAFPNYDGNGMYLSTGNVLVNPSVGLLFIDFVHGHRMRLEGEASIDAEDPLLDDYSEAQFVVRVRARKVHPNCPRYIHRYELVRRSRFVPHDDCATPVPEWKRSDWAFDSLPEHDPARHPGEREVLGR
ncbi:MAG: pyridoxamine 5'-phosphate oxidase family protein [Knoellia sp.]